MDYRFTAFLITMLCLLALFAEPAYPGSTQTNTSGSNTAIEGGYTSTATTTYQSGSSSNSTTNSTTNSNTKSAPPSASSPSYNSMTQDVCAVGGSLGIQTFGLGISGGKHFIDKNCERLKLARIHERPDYDTYVKRMEDRKKADEAEQAKITKEMEAIDKAREKEEAKNKKKIEWKDPR